MPVCVILGTYFKLSECLQKNRFRFSDEMQGIIFSVDKVYILFHGTHQNCVILLKSSRQLKISIQSHTNLFSCIGFHIVFVYFCLQKQNYGKQFIYSYSLYKLGHFETNFQNQLT